MNVDWGTASMLPAQTRSNVIRLGGFPKSPRSQDALQILTSEIKWPSTQFRSSTSLFRQLDSHSPPDEFDESALQDAMPVRCFRFRFVSRDEANELHDIMGLKSGDFRAIGRDDHRYFLIACNSGQPNDPLLYYVDQQSIDEPPYQPDNVTIGWLLSVLATA